MSVKKYAKHSYQGKHWKLVLEDTRTMLKWRSLGEGGYAQRYVDSEVLRRCTPYVPFETGELIRSGMRETRLGSGRVVYRTPYARRWYYRPANFFGAPKRGNYWFERMKANHGKAILRGAAKITGGDAK